MAPCFDDATRRFAIYYARLFAIFRLMPPYFISIDAAIFRHFFAAAPLYVAPKI